MTPADKLEALLADMEGTAAETREALATVEKLWVLVRSPSDESARIAEQLAIGKLRANLLDEWVDRLKAIRAEMGEAVPVAFRYLTHFRNGICARTRWLTMDEMHHYGPSGDLVKGPHPEWRVEYAYTTPPASVPVEALRELIGKWYGDQADYPVTQGGDLAAAAVRHCAQELATLIAAQEKP